MGVSRDVDERLERLRRPGGDAAARRGSIVARDENRGNASPRHTSRRQRVSSGEGVRASEYELDPHRFKSSGRDPRARQRLDGDSTPEPRWNSPPLSPAPFTPSPSFLPPSPTSTLRRAISLALRYRANRRPRALPSEYDPPSPFSPHAADSLLPSRTSSAFVLAAAARSFALAALSLL